jgi:hypothetical protein
MERTSAVHLETGDAAVGGPGVAQLVFKHGKKPTIAGPSADEADQN